MQDPANELRRITLPRTRVNRATQLPIDASPKYPFSNRQDTYHESVSSRGCQLLEGDDCSCVEELGGLANMKRTISSLFPWGGDLSKRTLQIISLLLG